MSCAKYEVKGGGGTGYYIGMTKCKIKDKIKEYVKDIKSNKTITGFSQIYYNNININFNSSVKFANYFNHYCAIKREIVKILSKEKCCNFRC